METYTIISDPGVDDIIALLLLSKLSPAHHLLISTFGNAPEIHTAQNAKEFISFIAPDWLYASGAKKPLKPLEHQWPAYFHGHDGVCGVHPDINTSHTKGQVVPYLARNVISLGPLTEVCHLLQKEKIENIMIMGGAINVPGNETAYAETNIAFDPDGAAQVFASCSNIDVKIVPLDVTKQVFWTKEDILQIPENKAYKIWIKKMFLSWLENYGGKRETVFHLHDPLAIYAIFFPDSLGWLTSGIQVVTTGEKRGQMILSKDNPPCKTALKVHNPLDISQRIFEMIFL